MLMMMMMVFILFGLKCILLEGDYENNVHFSELREVESKDLERTLAASLRASAMVNSGLYSVLKMDWADYNNNNQLVLI